MDTFRWGGFWDDSQKGSSQRADSQAGESQRSRESSSQSESGRCS